MEMVQFAGLAIEMVGYKLMNINNIKESSKS